ncbi:hypothetical protein BV20DRAFT_1036540 [Pilatotrama ljubarskyi]|nr:hypothetical protein BV20DRAFT_1036540 [Pilatotrama ljubarskyi]
MTITHSSTNLDRAIANVKEHGHPVTVPNVLAAYIQCIAAHLPPEDATDQDAIAQTAVASFERAMDKYPAPSPPSPSPRAKSRSSSKTKPVSQERAQAEAADVAPDCCLGTRMFCAEVAQLRSEYLKALWRASDDSGAPGCRCRSCGCLLKVCASQVRTLDPEEEDGLREREAARSVRKRRARKTKGMGTKKKARVPFDPYAPSTSRAAM